MGYKDEVKRIITKKWYYRIIKYIERRLKSLWIIMSGL